MFASIDPLSAKLYITNPMRRKCNHMSIRISCTAVYTLSVLQKLGNMTPEMTVSPLYIRARCLLSWNLSITLSLFFFSPQYICEILGFDRKNFRTIVPFYEYALFNQYIFFSYDNCTIKKYFYRIFIKFLRNLYINIFSLVLRHFYKHDYDTLACDTSAGKEID